MLVTISRSNGLGPIQAESGCRVLGSRINFDNFTQALFALFTVSSGDAYASVLEDLSREAPFCDPSSACTTNCCVSPWIARFFLVSFIVIVQYILFNIVVVSEVMRMATAMIRQPLQCRLC